MTETVEQLINRYKEVRHRLRYPPNAVPDTGINLKRSRYDLLAAQSAALPAEPESPKPQTQPTYTSPIPAPFVKSLTFSSTVQITAQEFGVPPSAIKSHKKTKYVSMARQVAMYLGWRQRGSFSWVGKQLKRDHTTVLHSVRKVTAMMAVDPEFRDIVQTIERKILDRHPSAFPTDAQSHLETREDGDVSLPPVPQLDQGDGSIIRDAEKGADQDARCPLCGGPAPAHHGSPEAA